MAVDLNLNNADCLREVYGFTERTVYNVCNGTNSVIPHGIHEYASAAFLTACFLAIGFAFYGMYRVSKY